MEIKVYHQILDWNEDVSGQVKETLKKHHTILINIMGSPGAGKTSLLKELIQALRSKYSLGVIEGDITTSIDAKTMADLGIPSVELNTDGACHIEAMSIQKILPEFDLNQIDVLFVENIGNLVCPAEFDIGETMRMTILSIPEGDDKVVKYPLMFTETDCLIINKADVLPYFDFDLDRVQKDYQGVNPGAPAFVVSAKDKSGIDALSNYLKEKIDALL